MVWTYATRNRRTDGVLKVTHVKLQHITDVQKAVLRALFEYVSIFCDRDALCRLQVLHGDTILRAWIWVAALRACELYMCYLVSRLRTAKELVIDQPRYSRVISTATRSA